MESSKIARLIQNKLNNTLCFTLSFENGKINSRQNEILIHFDIEKIITDRDKAAQNTTWFILHNISQAVEVIDIFSNQQDREKSKNIVADIATQKNLNKRDTLYFKVYLPSSCETSA